MLRATLPHPPGINRTYRSTRGGRWHKTDAATIWQEGAIILLRSAGFKTQPAGNYWIRLDLVLHTCRLDIDAPIKQAIDAVAAALGVDDRWIGALLVSKRFASRREEQRLEVRAELHPVENIAEWRRFSRDRAV